MNQSLFVRLSYSEDVNFTIHYADTMIPFLSFIRMELADNLRFVFKILIRLDLSSGHMDIYGGRVLAEKIKGVMLALPRKHQDITLLSKIPSSVDQLCKLIDIIQDSSYAIHKVISILNSKKREFF